MKRNLLATLALLLAGVLGGIAPIAAKTAFLELSPISVLFFRVTIMVTSLLFVVRIPWKILKKNWLMVVLLGILWTGNITLFIFGVKYTTSAMSQVIYALVPLFVALGNKIFLKTNIRRYQYIGIIIGFLGALYLVVPHTSGSFGTILGNSIIIGATVCWSIYLLLSKKISAYFSASQLTLLSAIIAWGICTVLTIYSEGTQPFVHMMYLSKNTWISLIFLGVIQSCGSLMLYNWAIKYASAIAAASMVYVSTFVGTYMGVVLLHEEISKEFIIGGIFLFVGLVLTTMIPLFHRKLNTV